MAANLVMTNRGAFAQMKTCKFNALKLVIWGAIDESDDVVAINNDSHYHYNNIWDHNMN